jgi:hypothetical protein
LRDCRQRELELSAARPAQAQTTEPKDALEMGKQHLNTFAIAARLRETAQAASGMETARSSTRLLYGT